ncbi:MAG TPA: 2-amino-4-hydroxy-6-hydroxymethyldihydropteridine diphosphokinase [Hanamia sp.]|nr:2-amino-4-hydroxy-6-hydroxymethyldihydropteridine diphosphokinase [Hanamia sp.]
MNKLFLVTGGNIGDRKGNLEAAAALIQKQIGKIIRLSAIYETEAWGITSQPAFYNQVLEIDTLLSAREVLHLILKIEEEMGRKRTIKNAARIIDIDILFFNNEIINEHNLIIPHPEIANRRFVLLPLLELDPTKLHPVLNKSIRELLAETKDKLKAIPVQTAATSDQSTSK